jgi:tetratricopeptide (TPR) repeat protein
MSLSAGDRLGRYEILGPLGAGGMGEVHRARDLELERDVAVKVLPEAVAENPDRLDRFRREAKAVAKLSHPNILEIYDYGREGEITYSVTELLEGETLRERLEGGTLGWRKATEIGAAIADGLAAAHEAGIVHRDLKPSNVFLTDDGRVKVLDFGLARHDSLESEESGTQAPTLTRHTDPGTVLGTVGYMSPEQVSGRAVDHRSDIFSLGCVLYEMVLGKRAFVRDTAVETMNAILKEEPADISASGEALPPELAGTVRRCLEKKPQSRFQSASDLAYNLRTISSASATTAAGPAPRVGGRRSAAWIAVAAVAAIAIVAGTVVWAPWRGAPEPTPDVLSNRVAIVPLENRTGDPSLDTLGVMAADLIVQRFTETGAVEVVPMADVVDELPSGGLEGDRKRGWSHVLGLSRERGAGLVVSGAYYVDDETLRLQARVDNAASGELIYTFEPVAVAREAAAEGIETLRELVLAAVAAHVNDPFINISVMSPPSSYEAFQSFERGSEQYGSNYPEAIRHFRRALEIDPDFHFARYNLIWAYSGSGDLTMWERELTAAEDYLNRMTPYDRTSIQYQRAAFNGDRQGQANALRHMLEIWPQSVDARTDLGLAAMWLNRPGEAVEVLEPILFSRTPSRFVLAWWSLRWMTEALHMLGDYERELEYAELGLERFPDVGQFHFAKARALAAMGLAAGATEVIDACLPVRLSEGGNNLGWVMTETAFELRAHGHRRASDDMVARAVAWWEREASESDIEKRESGDLSEQSYALFVAGRWDQAREPLEELNERGWRPIQVAGALGVIAARTGNHEEARRIFDDLPDPGLPLSAAQRSAWRALIAANLGEKDRAVDLLSEAFSQGMPYRIIWHSDPGLEPLWNYPPFQELIKPKG